jgi:hypothetical protein
MLSRLSSTERPKTILSGLENAARSRRRRSIEARADAFGAHDDKFAGFHIALVGRAQQIEGAGLRREDNRIFLLARERRNAAHGQRPKAARVAHGEDAVVADHDERKRPFDPAQRIGDGVGECLFPRERDQVDQNFRIAVGLENRSLPFELGADRPGIHQIAVVRDGHGALV